MTDIRSLSVMNCACLIQSTVDYFVISVYNSCRRNCMHSWESVYLQQKSHLQQLFQVWEWLAKQPLQTAIWIAQLIAFKVFTSINFLTTASFCGPVTLNLFYFCPHCMFYTSFFFSLFVRLCVTLSTTCFIQLWWTLGTVSCSGATYAINPIASGV